MISHPAMMLVHRQPDISEGEEEMYWVYRMDVAHLEAAGDTLLRYLR